jgi:molybdopterin converting factor small subunit
VADADRPGTVTVRLFSTAAQTAGTRRDTFTAGTIGGIVTLAIERYGSEFGKVLETSRVWLNGEPVARDETACLSGDEIAILPPVSGG